MAGDGNEGDVFAVPDFWQTSKWLDHLETGAPLLFNFSNNDGAGNPPPSVSPLIQLGLTLWKYVKATHTSRSRA